jgi:hypothetical protein
MCVLWEPGKLFGCTFLIWSQGPVLGDEVHQGEGHGEGAQEDVRDGEVRDKDVPGGEHHLRKKSFMKIFHIFIRISYISLVGKEGGDDGYVV